MLMYIELVVAQYMRDAHLDQFFLWMDNFSAHKTDPIIAMLQKYNIFTPFFPPNMTSILQVCDLHVNGPIKRKGRDLRAMRTYLAFQAYLEKYKNLSLKEKEKSKFLPPKPNIEDGIRDILTLFDYGGDFLKTKFEEGQTRCFIEVGCVPQTEGDSDFVEYNEPLRTRHNAALKVPMISYDIDTFNTNTSAQDESEDINQGIAALREFDSGSENEEEDYADD
jgi:hypothetical protein